MSIELEKPEQQFIEKIQTSSIDDQQLPDDFSDVDEKKVMRKIDYRLLPVTTLLYLLSYMDRGNIGNARIEGLSEDLKITDDQFSLCLMIFFISYSICEIPSNILLKYMGKQSTYISTLMVLWGIVMTCMGFVNNFAGLFSLRLLLGIFEAGLYPGITFGLTMYYKRSDMLSRQCLFYSGASSAGAFSGILAFAIGKMDGVAGYRGWRWIFILEGIMTFVVAIACYWILIDYPQDCKFLTEREKAFIIWRLKTDNNTKETITVDQSSSRYKDSTRAYPDLAQFDEKDDISMREALKNTFSDWQILTHILLYWGIIVPIYGVSMFAPSVVKSLGYTSSKAQLMTVPVYVVACLFGIAQAFLSDYVGLRSPFAIFDLLLGIIGIGVIIHGTKTDQPHVVYGALFVFALGFTAGFPNFITWNSNNLSNARKRAVGMAAQIGIGNFGGAAASFVYRNGNLLRGHYMLLGFTCLAWISTLVLIAGYSRSNAKDLKDLKEGKYDNYTDRELFRMGDKSPFFKYRL